MKQRQHYLTKFDLQIDKKIVDSIKNLFPKIIFGPKKEDLKREQ